LYAILCCEISIHMALKLAGWYCVVSQKSRISCFKILINFWHWNFTFNSNKSPTWCNNFSVY